MDKSTIDYCVEVFRSVGFPAIMVYWFAMRAEKRLDELTKAILALHPEVK